MNKVERVNSIDKKFIGFVTWTIIVGFEYLILNIVLIVYPTEDTISNMFVWGLVNGIIISFITLYFACAFVNYNLLIRNYKYEKYYLLEDSDDI